MHSDLRRATTLTIVIALLLQAAACIGDGGADKKYRVEILLFGAHPLLVSVADGIKEGAYARLESLGLGRDSVEFTVQDANFQPLEATQQTKQALIRKPSAVVALGTPSIKAALVNRDDAVPVFFAAASDPKALGLTQSNKLEDWRAPNAFSAPPNVYGTITDFQYEKMALVLDKVSHMKGRGAQGECVRVGYPLNEAESNSVLALEKLQELLPAQAFCFTRAPIASPSDVPGAVRNLLSNNVNLIQVGPDNTVAGGIGSILSLTQGKGIPILASEKESVRRGALAAFGVDFRQLGMALGARLIDRLKQGQSSGVAVDLFSSSKLYVNPGAVNEFIGNDGLKSLIQQLGIGEGDVEEVR
jgi:putative ABC transport system substrate-binding protein